MKQKIKFKFPKLNHVTNKIIPSTVRQQNKNSPKKFSLCDAISVHIAITVRDEESSQFSVFVEQICCGKIIKKIHSYESYQASDISFSR